MCKSFFLLNDLPFLSWHALVQNLYGLGYSDSKGRKGMGVLFNKLISPWICQKGKGCLLSTDNITSVVENDQFRLVGNSPVLPQELFVVFSPLEELSDLIPLLVVLFPIAVTFHRVGSESLAANFLFSLDISGQSILPVDFCCRQLIWDKVILEEIIRGSFLSV